MKKILSLLIALIMLWPVQLWATDYVTKTSTSTGNFEFSTDGDLGSSDTIISSQQAIKTYVDAYSAPASAYLITTRNVAALTNASNLGSLSTGLLKMTVSGGVAVLSVAVDGDDYLTTASTLHASLTSISGLTETNGGLLYGTADNTYAWLAAGTSGYLLQGNGAGAPTWVTALANGFTATTQSAGDNSTKVATTAYANALVSDTAYAGSWDTVTGIAPSKNAVYDRMVLLATLASPTFTGTVTLPKTTEIQDTSADHQYVLAVSELTADRTITLPLLTGADEFVFKDFTQTLTNKTLTAPVVGSNLYLHDAGGEYIGGDGTDLTITSSAKINLTAVSDVVIPANVGITFGDDGEKIEGDGTNLTISSSGTLSLNSTGVITASNQGIADNAVVTIDSADVADNDYAKFTANGLEGRSYAEARTDLDVGWKLIPAANYTATPASTSTITMGVDMTASILVGDTLRYTIGGTEYFGMVTAIAADLLTVAGAPLSGDVSNLQYGGGEVTQLTYSNADSVSVVTTGTKYTLRWYKKKSYMVFYAVKMIAHDTHATEAKLTWKINATEVNTSAGGLSIAANDTFYLTVVDIATAAYDVNRGEDITLVATQGGSIDGYGIVANAIIITP